ncbi:hypothetical protein [Oceanidesulfovibrio marinus]|uniref:Haemolysin XhlA n=1 Tax=Oceanidesulfovibrio marinus TaxID=370038 RepID=A0A6P1ZJ57_9BACT|nr:hypothetical protein [Oceanidesulfovibrio marinus]TVM35613.1 hypothetical protein DQK91_02815 [Oceanidesulfovibrio marinus]
MTTGDTSAIWEALDGVRAEQSQTNQELAEIKTILCERCEAREKRIADMETDVKGLRQRVWIFSGATGVLAWLASRLDIFK